MAKAIYSDDMKSVTYRGKTFRVGEKVKIYRDTDLGVGLLVGQAVRILNINNNQTVVCEDKTGDVWWLLLEDLFAYSEEDEPHQTQPERKPWDMPELKPWMRVVNHFSTYIITEVNGVLTGLRVGGCEDIEYLKGSAKEIYDAPLLPDGTIARYQALDTEHKGELLWTRSEAEKLRLAHEAKESRKAGIQAEINKLKAQLERLDNE